MCETNKSLIPKSLDKALENITDKTSSAIGTTIADGWFLVFGGISQAADKRRAKYVVELQKYKHDLDKAIESIPEEKRIEPQMQVVGQAFEKSKYCVEEKSLRDMFINVISNSANIDYSSKVHPSFPEIISQMSPLDAENLMRFKKEGEIPLVIYRGTSSIDGFVDFYKNIFLPDIPLGETPLYSASIDSLSRLGLITISYTNKLHDPKYYDCFRNSNSFKEFSSTFEPAKPEIEHLSPDLQCGVAELSSLGKDFLYVCCP